MVRRTYAITSSVMCDTRVNVLPYLVRGHHVCRAVAIGRRRSALNGTQTKTRLSAKADSRVRVHLRGDYGVVICPFACRLSWLEKLSATVMRPPKRNVNAT